jgi:hypothetical protein
MGLTRLRKKNKKMHELEWKFFPFQNFPQAKNDLKNAQYRFQKLVKLSNVFTYILLSCQLQAPHSNSANIHFISGAGHTKSHEHNQIAYVLNIQKHMHVRTVTICNTSNINTAQLGSLHWCSTVTKWSLPINGFASAQWKNSSQRPTACHYLNAVSEYTHTDANNVRRH